MYLLGMSVAGLAARRDIHTNLSQMPPVALIPSIYTRFALNGYEHG